jgi:hypothetical protein
MKILNSHVRLRSLSLLWLLVLVLVLVVVVVVVLVLVLVLALALFLRFLLCKTMNSCLCCWCSLCFLGSIISFSFSCISLFVIVFNLL